MITGGAMRLGALVGFNQSFELPARAVNDPALPSSWSTGLGTSVHSQAASTLPGTVHSSGLGMRFYVGSGGAADDPCIVFDYAQAAAWQALCPGNAGSNHTLNASVWGNIYDGGNLGVGSGTLLFAMRINSSYFRASTPFSLATLWRANMDDPSCQVNQFTSSLAFTVLLNRFSGASSGSFALDDVLVRLDELVLHPTWDMADLSNMIKSTLRTQGGGHYTTIFGKRFAWSVPVEYLSNSAVDLLHWWHGNGFPLHFWWDSSNAEASYVVRIVNDGVPAAQRMSPYTDQWRAVLQLESVIGGGLAF